MAKKILPHVNVVVDGVNLNARHFAKFTRDEAVKKMIEDKISTDEGETVVDEKWAGEAYDKILVEIDKFDNPDNYDKNGVKKTLVNPGAAIAQPVVKPEEKKDDKNK